MQNKKQITIFLFVLGYLLWAGAIVEVVVWGLQIAYTGGNPIPYWVILPLVIGAYFIVGFVAKRRYEPPGSPFKLATIVAGVSLVGAIVLAFVQLISTTTLWLSVLQAVAIWLTVYFVIKPATTASAT